MTDIDIDFADPTSALIGLTHVAATMEKDDGRYRHSSGVYFQDIPTDPLDGMAAWEYREAAEHGYFKIDFLTNSIYRGVKDEAHLIALLATEPPWDLLLDREVVEHLAHIRGHYAIVRKIQPTTITDLAVCIALVRPGKTYLIDKPRATIDREIWTKTDKFSFKKSHAISYAAAIVVQLNLLIEQALQADAANHA